MLTIADYDAAGLRPDRPVAACVVAAAWVGLGPVTAGVSPQILCDFNAPLFLARESNAVIVKWKIIFILRYRWGGSLDSVPGTRPSADVRVDVPLVCRLVAAQFPRWASLAVEPVESAGWDNTIFRLGSDLTVRLPRRRVSAEHVRNEHQ
jgi:hypothetical protein